MSIKLSKRLTTLTEMVTPGNIVCDVGTDHAHVPIRLLQDGKIQAAVAMDVRPGPLDIAKENLELFGLSDKVSLRLSDGLAAYEIGEAQTLIIAGMGGLLMRNILAEEPEKTEDFVELILEPQSEYWAVRDYLMKNGFAIVYEDAVLEDGKSYPFIKAVPAGPVMTGNVDYDGTPMLSSSAARTVHPDWDLYADKVEAMSEEEISEAKVKRQTILTMLRDEHFRYQAEIGYGPYLIKKKHPVLDRYVRVMLRKKLGALEELTKSASLENEEAQKKAGALAEDVGILQVLLFLFTYIM